MDRRNRNTGPNARDRINKQPTAAAEGREEPAFDMTGNVRERGEDPSPDDRGRGERSNKEPTDTTATGRC
jgi:hypothetical protein